MYYSALTNDSDCLLYKTFRLIFIYIICRLLDSLVVECWIRVPSQGPRYTKYVIKMVLVVPLCSTQH